MITLKIPAIRKPLSIHSIAWIEGYHNYATIHFVNGRRYTATRTLKWFENQLPGFVRLHKGVLVNGMHIVEITSARPGDIEVSVRTGAILSVARRRKKLVKQQLNVLLSPLRSVVSPVTQYQ